MFGERVQRWAPRQMIVSAVLDSEFNSDTLFPIPKTKRLKIYINQDENSN